MPGKLNLKDVTFNNVGTAVRAPDTFSITAKKASITNADKGFDIFVAGQSVAIDPPLQRAISEAVNTAVAKKFTGKDLIDHVKNDSKVIRFFKDRGFDLAMVALAVPSALEVLGLLPH